MTETSMRRQLKGYNTPKITWAQMKALLTLTPEWIFVFLVFVLCARKRLPKMDPKFIKSTITLACCSHNSFLTRRDIIYHHAGPEFFTSLWLGASSCLRRKTPCGHKTLGELFGRHRYITELPMEWYDRHYSITPVWETQVYNRSPNGRV